MRKDRPGDPRIGAIGGSYGGGYQYVGAFREVATKGRTRFDALAPEYTWWDINDALAPSGVVRSEWLSALWALGHASQAHTDQAVRGFPEGLATGQYPEACGTFWDDNGPRAAVAKGLRLDVPVLVRQGVSDNLFNLNQGLKNLTALTPKARARSVFVGFHGGHALPAVLPARLAGRRAGRPRHRRHRPLLARRCRAVRATSSTCSCASSTSTSREPGPRPRGGPLRPGHPRRRLPADREARAPPRSRRRHRHDAGRRHRPARSTSRWRRPAHRRRDARTSRPTVTTLTPDARAFFALAVGTSAADATVVHSNLLPHREAAPWPVRSAGSSCPPSR